MRGDVFRPTTEARNGTKAVLIGDEQLSHVSVWTFVIARAILGCFRQRNAGPDHHWCRSTVPHDKAAAESVLDFEVNAKRPRLNLLEGGTANTPPRRCSGHMSTNKVLRGRANELAVAGTRSPAGIRGCAELRRDQRIVPDRPNDATRLSGASEKPAAERARRRSTASTRYQKPAFPRRLFDAGRVTWRRTARFSLEFPSSHVAARQKTVHDFRIQSNRSRPQGKKKNFFFSEKSASDRG